MATTRDSVDLKMATMSVEEMDRMLDEIDEERNRPSVTSLDLSISPPDLVLKPEAAGAKVVDAVLDYVSDTRFRDQHNFLRRVALYESDFGLWERTFRDGFHGGIWQVDKDQFKATQTSRNSRLTKKLAELKLHFGIDWHQVQREELRKPLHSYLAARLWFGLQSEPIPSDLKQQAKHWNKYFDEEAIGSDKSWFRKIQAAEAAGEARAPPEVTPEPAELREAQSAHEPKGAQNSKNDPQDVQDLHDEQNGQDTFAMESDADMDEFDEMEVTTNESKDEELDGKEAWQAAMDGHEAIYMKLMFEDGTPYRVVTSLTTSSTAFDLYMFLAGRFDILTPDRFIVTDMASKLPDFATFLHERTGRDGRDVIQCVALVRTKRASERVLRKQERKLRLSDGTQSGEAPSSEVSKGIFDRANKLAKMLSSPRELLEDSYDDCYDLDHFEKFQVVSNCGLLFARSVTETPREAPKQLFHLLTDQIGGAHFRFRKQTLQLEKLARNRVARQWTELGFASVDLDALASLPTLSMASKEGVEVIQSLANNEEEAQSGRTGLQTVYVRELHQRAVVHINDEIVGYSPAFLKKLDAILALSGTTQQTRKQQVRRLSILEKQYGSLYVSEAVVGAELVMKGDFPGTSDEDAKKATMEVLLSLEGGLTSMKAGTSFGFGETRLGLSDGDIETTSQRLYVRGGEPSVASLGNVATWSATVGLHENWVLVEARKLRPWYALLDQKRKSKVVKLINEAKRNSKNLLRLNDIGAKFTLRTKRDDEIISKGKSDQWFRERRKQINARKWEETEARQHAKKEVETLRAQVKALRQAQERANVQDVQEERKEIMEASKGAKDSHHVRFDVVEENRDESREETHDKKEFGEFRDIRISRIGSDGNDRDVKEIRSRGVSEVSEQKVEDSPGTPLEMQDVKEMSPNPPDFMRGTTAELDGMWKKQMQIIAQAKREMAKTTAEMERERSDGTVTFGSRLNSLQQESVENQAILKSDSTQF